MARAPCPHADIRFCPLYIAAHSTDGYGCALVDPDYCDSGSKAAYAKRIAALAETITGRVLIEHCANAEEEAAWRAQRKRNMKAAGLR
jgi:hypothetical protein